MLCLGQGQSQELDNDDQESVIEMYIEMNAGDEVSKFNEAEQLEKFVSVSVCFEFNFEPSLTVNSLHYPSFSTALVLFRVRAM